MCVAWFSLDKWRIVFQMETGISKLGLVTN